MNRRLKRPKPLPPPPPAQQIQPPTRPKARFVEPSAAPRPIAFAASPEVLARAAAEIAAEVEHAVANDQARADRVLARCLKRRRDLAPPDALFISQATFALFRWRGWIEPLGLETIEARLEVALLLEEPEVPLPCRVWARSRGIDPQRLFGLGDAPDWKAKSEGFRRLVGGGRHVVADPWRLFPPWFRQHITVPPGASPIPQRLAGFLFALQKRPALWIRAQGTDPEKLWKEMRAQGLNPWVHRRMLDAARLGPEVDVYHLPAFERGQLEIQDLAAQAVARVCDPDPGERWWDACAGAGGKALHLAALMTGKGLVVATDVHDYKLKETVRRARRGPFRNITTKAWDGRRVPGKTTSFDGVLVDAPCSAIGTWRRNPEARWNLDEAAIARLAAVQKEALDKASAGVRVGGRLVYAVCTVTPTETSRVVQDFLAKSPGFQLDPFPNPLTGESTDGTLMIWPGEADSDAMFIARFVRVK